MTTNICIVTHNQIGQELLTVVATMVDISQLNIHAIGIPSDIDSSQLAEYSKKVSTTIKKCGRNENKLILCDIYGATPFNIIKDLSQLDNIKIITGLNLAMLLKAAQLTQKPFNDMIQEVLLSATKSIILE